MAVGISNSAVQVLVRPLAPPDVDRIAAVADAFSVSSLYRRYAVTTAAVPSYALARLGATDGDRYLAVVAEAGEQVVGWAEATVTGPDESHIAVLVADAWQHRGVGSALLRELVAELAARGVTHLHADVQPDNVPVRRMLLKAWPGAEPQLADGFLAFDVEVGRSAPERLLGCFGHAA